MVENYVDKGSNPFVATNESRCKMCWRENRAKFLWERAGCPKNRDLEFWLQAEKDFNNDICILPPEHCPHQLTMATEGGKHVAICTNKDNKCPYHARDYNS